MAQFSLKTRVNGSLAAIKPRVVAALKDQGFGVLTEIDIQGTFREKLGADFMPYELLGACNPPLAYKALNADPDIGLLLPCPVALWQDGEQVVVSILDPTVLFSIVDPELQQQLAELPNQVRKRMEAVLAALADG